MVDGVPVTGNGSRATHRQRILRALDVVPYALRRPVRAELASATCAVANASATTCVLVLPADCDARQLTLVGHIMHALGETFARAQRVQVTAGTLQGEVPRADAYLAFGEPQAQGLGRALAAAAQAHAEVVLLDAPDALLQAAAKRRLWQAAAGLRRRWRAAAMAGS